LKKLVIISIFICLLHSVSAQETVNANTEQQLENLADDLEAETEDDNYLQQLIQFRKTPLNLNIVQAVDLKDLKMLSDLQIENFISYRKLMGKLISIYELQSIPTWDLFTIKRVLPYIIVGNALSAREDFAKRIRGGEHIFLTRFMQVIETSKGYTPKTAGNYYQGGKERLFFRYRYQYKNLLQYGIVGDKDAGEQFFKGTQKRGFDFYSAHLFLRNMGVIQNLALGDFTVNMGQGLIHWQGLAFGKSVDVMGIKRQSSILRPYNSAGEILFHRGGGITLKKGKFESTVFASLRNMSTNRITDTVSREDYFSSFQTSGYHRTASELFDRNNMQQKTVGGNFTVRSNRWHIGFNGISYQFSLPLVKSSLPYNYYALNGKSWYNFSTDYSFTHRNLHFFGEAAMDKRNYTAFVNGLLVSVDPRVDISVLHRKISKGYQAINGNAFTENTNPSNESGLYSGISIKPTPMWRIDAYADFFSFPFLKYQVDGPSRGREYLTQVTYIPNKQIELYIRYRNDSKQTNQSGNTTVSNYLVFLPKQNLRTQISYKVTPAITIRNRNEILWFDKKGPNAENGFLTYVDFFYKPMMKPLAANLRLQYFETDGYNSRVYAYENDVLYYFSIPAFYDKGYRYYMNINYDVSKKLTVWVKWSQLIYEDRNVIGSGLDEIQGNKKSEIKVQGRLVF
jgi:hypothetical protein